MVIYYFPEGGPTNVSHTNRSLQYSSEKFPFSINQFWIINLLITIHSVISLSTKKVYNEIKAVKLVGVELHGTEFLKVSSEQIRAGHNWLR